MKERRCRQVEEEREEEEDDEQVAMAVSMLDLSSQGSHCGSQVGRGLYVDKCRQSRGKNLLEDYFIQNSLYSIVDFLGRYRMQPYLFNKIMQDVCNYDAYFVQKCDATGILGLFLEQKLTASLWMLAFVTFANQVDEIARMRKSIILESLVTFCDAIETLYMRDYLCKPTSINLQRLLQKAKSQGFPSMIGSIDCMH
ncbi:unnamed protein product [Prunus armeniaca]